MSKKEKPPNWEDLHLIFRRNLFPGMLQYLADDLGVTVESLDRLEIGFYPGKQAWIVPERDHTGRIIGLQQRFMDGKKFMWPGSKRGLVYE